MATKRMRSGGNACLTKCEREAHLEHEFGEDEEGEEEGEEEAEEE